MSLLRNSILKHGLQMRRNFDLSKFILSNWFPGHMAKGLMQMQKILKDVDCVVEVHDCRVPFCGRNPLFENNYQGFKPYILVLNKIDLIEKEQKNIIEKYYSNKGFTNLLFTNCKDVNSAGVKELLTKATDLIRNSQRFHRDYNLDFSIMIIGIPNVGKSSLINILRARNMSKGKATSVGAAPGITKSVLERIKVQQKPPIYLYDTPGVLTPNVGDLEVALKLAVVNTLKDHLIGEIIIADYLLYRMNLMGNHSYVDFLQVDEPTDDITQLILKTCMRHKLSQKVRRFGTEMSILPDRLEAANMFIRGYRNGKLGMVTIDDFDEVVKE